MHSTALVERIDNGCSRSCGVDYGCQFRRGCGIGDPTCRYGRPGSGELQPICRRGGSGRPADHGCWRTGASGTGGCLGGGRLQTTRRDRGGAFWATRRAGEQRRHHDLCAP